MNNEVESPIYPTKYITTAELSEGTIVHLRPIHPSDGKQAMQFKASLSDESIKSRFLGYIPEVSDAFVKHLVEIDYAREMAIIAEVGTQDQKQVIGIGRIVPDLNAENATELAIIISDHWQGKNLGSILTGYMIRIAKDMGYAEMFGTTYNDNTPMLEILKHYNFTLEKDDYATMKGCLKL